MSVREPRHEARSSCEDAGLVVRPAAAADLPALERLADSAVPRLTNLPAHRDRLEERIAHSCRAFAGEGRAPADEHYTFVLEDRGCGEVVGTAGIRARAGAREAYYTYRRETLIHASQQLEVRREVPTLALSHEVSEASLLCALSLDPRYRGGHGETLLRRSRLLFIAQYPERFAATLAMAFPGYLDEAGRSPFWDSVGHHFFARDYQEINTLAGVRSKSFIAEVMPQFPLYLALLTPQARAAIGREHPDHEAALAEMLGEGLARSRHVDLFDAGPVLEGECGRLASIRRAAWHPVRLRTEALPEALPAMVANQRSEAFRCAVVPRVLSPSGQLILSPAHAELLAVDEGHAVLATPLTLPDQEGGP